MIEMDAIREHESQALPQRFAPSEEVPGADH